MESTIDIASRILSIHPKYCVSSQIRNTIECFVSRKWIRNIQDELNYKIPTCHPGWSEEEIHSVLQLGSQTDDAWCKILIQVLHKENYEVISIPEKSTFQKCQSKNGLSYSQLLHYVSSGNMKNIWRESFQKYKNHAVFRNWKGSQRYATESHADFLRKSLIRLYNCSIISIRDGNSFCNKSKEEDQFSLIQPCFFIVESEEYFFIFLQPSLFSVWDCISFSPSKIKGNETGSLFLIYQLLEAIHFVQENGLLLGDTTLHNLRLHPDFSITLIPSFRNSFIRASEIDSPFSTECDKKDSIGFPKEFSLSLSNSNKARYINLLSSEAARNILSEDKSNQDGLDLKAVRSSLLQLVEKWVLHEISNFDYLLCLNYFSAHSFDSPVFYPIIPWVTDFSVQSGGWRDLTKSKFRLNKGDQQLDHTYTVLEDGANQHQIPHHIPEFFSEVTYYVYKARTTAKEVLTKHVRQQFVASHYPSSIERMYALTPEECIPEFYSDPAIFKSIHNDLPDLAVPPWCETTEEFIKEHRTLLESNYVSRRLHHWVDLYYGYKLSGGASIKAKNVCLPLVDSHESLSKGGIIQLFTCPHPPKLTPSPFLSRSPPLPFQPNIMENEDQNFKASKSAGDVGKTSNYKQSRNSLQNDKNVPLKIELSSNYNPLTALNQLEMFHNFHLKLCGHLPCQFNPDINHESSLSNILHLKKVRDMQTFGCLTMQMFCSNTARLVNVSSNLSETFLLAVNNLRNTNDIPKALLGVLKSIFNLSSSDIKSEEMVPSQFFSVSDNGIPPPSSHQLLQSAVKSINFPSVFSQLSVYVRKMKSYWMNVEDSYLSKSNVSDLYTESHVKLTLRLLKQVQYSDNSGVIKLLIPFVKELYCNPLSSACAAWFLTDILFQCTLPNDSRKEIISLLIRLFESDSVVGKYHSCLFHRRFLQVLLVRLKLKTFIKHFVTPIIEGAGGHKNINRDIRTIIPLDRSKTLSDLSSNGNNGKLSPADSKRMNESNCLGLNYTDKSTDISNTLSEDSLASRQASLFVSDSEEDQEIFIFQSEEEDLLNKEAEYSPCDLHQSTKFPISKENPHRDSSSFDERLSVCSFSHSPTASDTEDSSSSEVTLRNPQKHLSSTDNVPIPQKRAVTAPFSDFICTSLPDDSAKDFSSSLPLKQVTKEVTHQSANISAGDDCAENKTGTMEIIESSPLNEICCENIIWLSHRLGPVLTARHLSRNLLRMLSICYQPESGSLFPISFSSSKRSSITMKSIAGDVDSENIIRCLIEIADIYGEQFIFLQYISHVTEVVNWCGNELKSRQEASLIGAMTLLQYLLVKISDVAFMECLQETLIRNAVYPVIRLLSSVKVFFPSGSEVRSILAWRVLDSLFIIVQRVGPEMTKDKLMPAITRFFTAFDKVHSLKFSSSYKKENIRNSNESHYAEEERDKIIEQLKSVFIPELAFLSYIPLCKFLGAKCMKEYLPNHALIQSMCLLYDENNQADLAAKLSAEIHLSSKADTKTSDIFSSKTNVKAKAAVTGNRIDIKESSSVDGFLAVFNDISASVFDIKSCITSLKSPGVENGNRHIKGNWLAYWQHEIGRSETETRFDFKQIRLQTFVGHSSSVKSLRALDNENSFLSCSKDKTVKLWSIKSQGDGSAECGFQWSYSNHRKSVFEVTYCEPLRLVVSCDSTVHIWDPFTGQCLKQLDSLKHSPVTVLSSLADYSTQVLVATTDSTLKLVDLRTMSYAHELKISANSVGLVRCVATSGDGCMVAVAHSSGVVATLDLRTGQLLSTWKPHEGEILSLQWYNKGTFVSSALDHTICVWDVSDTKRKFYLKGPTEPAHLLKLFDDQVVSGTTANRIGLHSGISTGAEFSCTKLRSSTFKGVLTAMAVLPFNRQLLLGSDNGHIRLLC